VAAADADAPLAVGDVAAILDPVLVIFPVSDDVLLVPKIAPFPEFHAPADAGPFGFPVVLSAATEPLPETPDEIAGVFGPEVVKVLTPVAVPTVLSVLVAMFGPVYAVPWVLPQALPDPLPVRGAPVVLSVLFTNPLVLLPPMK